MISIISQLVIGLTDALTLTSLTGGDKQMIGMPSIYGGIKIFYNSSCLEKTEEPRKEHVKKSWMRESYHNRIQKKWTKRYGCVMRPTMYKVAGLGIVAHPSLKALVESSLEAVSYSHREWR